MADSLDEAKAAFRAAWEAHGARCVRSYARRGSKDVNDWILVPARIITQIDSQTGKPAYD